jgi:hypothetical protein
MVDASKAFAKEPPLRPLDDLDAVVEDFQWRYVDRKKTDQVIEFCRTAPDLRTAIKRAVRSRDAGGKHHNHQSKVDITARMTFGNRIWGKRVTVYNIKRKPPQFTHLKFDLLHDLFDHIKPFGIGPVTVYDVAVRVGAYLDIEPHSVYLHAGVRQGLKALEAATLGQVHPDWFQQGKVPVHLMPGPLGHMKADDVEDILCTYRQVFESWT